MMKRNIALLLAAALLAAAALTACAGSSGPEVKTEFDIGETVSTYWFDFTVDSVETADRCGTYQAEAGYRLVVCRLTIQNTFKDTVPMGWADFVLLWERPEGDDSEEMDGTYPIPAGYTPEQFPEEYDMEKDDTAQGVLIFEVPEDLTRAAVMFQELYADSESESQYTEGTSYLVWLTL